MGVKDAKRRTQRKDAPAAEGGPAGARREGGRPAGARWAWAWPFAAAGFVLLVAVGVRQAVVLPQASMLRELAKDDGPGGAEASRPLVIDVYHNASSVFTGSADPERALAGSFAVHRGSGKLLVVFPPAAREEAIREAFASMLPADADVRWHSLDGAFVTPGIVDAHVHLLTGGRQLEQIQLEGARSLEGLAAAVGAAAAARAPEDAGDWLEGAGWHEQLMGGVWPDRHLLDAAVPGGATPVWLTRADLHAGVCNSAALERANVTVENVERLNAEIDGGAFDVVLGAGGEVLELTGVIRENAMDIITAAIDEDRRARDGGGGDEVSGRAEGVAAHPPTTAPDTALHPGGGG